MSENAYLVEATPVMVNGQAQGAEPICWDHPIDRLEPLSVSDPERDIKVRFLGILGNSFGELQGALEKGDARFALQRFYGIAFALGLTCVDYLTMTEAAKRCGCSRALISRIAVNFCELNGLPPSHHMKQNGASTSYREARFRHLDINAMNDENLIAHYESLDPESQLRFLGNPDYKKRLKKVVDLQKL
jgi:hypothetical protein